MKDYKPKLKSFPSERIFRKTPSQNVCRTVGSRVVVGRYHSRYVRISVTFFLFYLSFLSLGAVFHEINTTRLAALSFC